jgi:hypothetical protein
LVTTIKEEFNIGVNEPPLPVKQSILSVSLEEIVNTIIKKINEIIVQPSAEPGQDNKVNFNSGVEKTFEGTNHKDKTKCTNNTFYFGKDLEVLQKGGTETADKKKFIIDNYNSDVYKNLAIILTHVRTGSQPEKIQLFKKDKSLSDILLNTLKSTKEYNNIYKELFNKNKEIKKPTQQISI